MSSVEQTSHWVKSAQIRTSIVFIPNAGKYGPEITPYLDTFHVVKGRNHQCYQKGVLP